MENRVAVSCIINHLRDKGDIYVRIPAATGDNSVAWVQKENLVIEQQRPVGRTMRGFVLGSLLNRSGGNCSVIIEQQGVPVTLELPENEVMLHSDFAELWER